MELCWGNGPAAAEFEYCIGNRNGKIDQPKSLERIEPYLKTNESGESPRYIEATWLSSLRLPPPANTQEGGRRRKEKDKKKITKGGLREVMEGVCRK